MDLEKIRNMNDEELKKYLKSLSNKENVCVKCDKKKPNYTINIKNKKIYQQKKLCSLCNDCYNDLINHLGICDIIWD